MGKPDDRILRLRHSVVSPLLYESDRFVHAKTIAFLWIRIKNTDDCCCYRESIRKDFHIACFSPRSIVCSDVSEDIRLWEGCQFFQADPLKNGYHIEQGAQIEK